MVAGYNTIRFLFNDEDLSSSSENKVTFIFGTAPVEPPCGVIWQDTINGNVSFECACSPYEDNTNFVVNCTGATSTEVVFTNVRAQVGFTSTTKFSIEIYNSISSYGYNSIGAIIASDMRIISDANFGYYSYAPTLSKTAYISSNQQFGYDSSTNILYNPYNKLLPDGEHSESVFGCTADSTVTYDPYNLLFAEGEFGTSVFGHYTSSVITYDPYNEFFDDGEYGSSIFGYVASSYVIFNPYNEFFPVGQDGKFYFGYYNSSTVQFNQSNPFTGDINSYFGYSVDSNIRYSDDPYINDINAYFGHDSYSSIKYADVRANISSNQYIGFTSYSEYQYAPGFITSSYFGYAGKLRYFRTNVTTAIFNNCISGFGFNLNDNGRRPYFFDLSRTECCTKISQQLKHIEMKDEHDYDVRYGNHIGWGIACIADFQTRPRFSANAYFGEASNVTDNSVYLGQIEIGFGLTANTRNMYLEKNYDIPYGNFIIDQNEIKVELTKPLDDADPNNSFILGYSAHTNLGACYNFGLTKHIVGFNSYLQELTIEEAIKPIAWFGYTSYSNLGRQASFYPLSYIGFTSRALFYENPYYMHYGYLSTCDDIITENFVELLEEGELDNDYIYQNENGDPDLDRPNKESIEGMPFTRYIKGRCY